MALIAGVNIPDNKRLSVALRSIYGVGETRANQVADTAGITGNPKVRDLNDEEVARFSDVVARLRPLAMSALNAAAARSAERIIPEVLGDRLAELLEPGTTPDGAH